LCSSRKYPYSPHRGDWNFLGGGGSLRLKNLKKCMELNWNFQRGGEVLGKIPSVGRYGYFRNYTLSPPVPPANKRPNIGPNLN